MVLAKAVGPSIHKERVFCGCTDLKRLSNTQNKRFIYSSSLPFANRVTSCRYALTSTYTWSPFTFLKHIFWKQKQIHYFPTFCALTILNLLFVPFTRKSIGILRLHPRVVLFNSHLEILFQFFYYTNRYFYTFFGLCFCSRFLITWIIILSCDFVQITDCFCCTVFQTLNLRT